MGLIKGGALRLVQTLLYVLCFLCTGLITGIFGYFLSVLADRDLPIATKWKAVIGLAGVACLYTMFAVLLTCCLAGKKIFSFIGLVMDLLCMGAMVAVAVLARRGTKSCSGNVNTPLGSGPSDSSSTGYGANGFGFGDNENLTYAPKLGLACRLQKAVFIVAIIAAVLFLLTALMQIFLVRHHKKEQRFGPSPSNNYTSGTAARKPWQRKPKVVTEKDAELGNVAPVVIPTPHHTVRPSHDTAYTGSTVAAPTGNKILKKEVDPATLSHAHAVNVENPNSTIYGNMTSEPQAEHAPHVGWTPHGHSHSHQNSNTGYAYDETVPATGAARNF